MDLHWLGGIPTDLIMLEVIACFMIRFMLYCLVALLHRSFMIHDICFDSTYSLVYAMWVSYSIVLLFPTELAHPPLPTFQI